MGRKKRHPQNTSQTLPEELITPMSRDARPCETQSTSFTEQSWVTTSCNRMAPQTVASYSDGFNQQLRPLLDKYDMIRHQLEDDPDLHATSIVVIGDQSSGKSSVLESLVQIGLPRGENIVTRMPIILQCRCLRPESREKPHAKVSISSPNDERSFNVEDFSDLERTIQTCQETVMKDEENMGMDAINRISETPIYVQIVKEGIPDVTLIDLPGINYANETIKGQIGALYKRYIQPSNVIILNVISAVTDVKANESVLYAKKVDPKEQRTIFVLTKVDKCSRNDVLAKVRELKSADSRFVFVRNRNPEEIATNVSWSEIRQKEKTFLAELAEVDKAYKGVPALASILVEEGCKMILQSVDQLLDDVPQILKRLKEELYTMGEPCVTAIEKKSYFDKVSHRISPRIQQLLNGSSNADDPEKLLLNSNIQNFLKTFEEKFSKGADMIFTGDFKRQIEKNLDATEGLTLPNFLSNPVFSTMLNRLMKNSGVYEAITRGVILGDTTGDPDSGIIPYINSVMDVLIDEALKGRTIDERFGKHLRDNVKGLIEKTGTEVAETLTQLVDAELEAGPYTTDSQYLQSIRNVESQIEILKRKREHESAKGKEVAETFTFTFDSDAEVEEKPSTSRFAQGPPRLTPKPKQEYESAKSAKPLDVSKAVHSKQVTVEPRGQCASISVGQGLEISFSEISHLLEDSADQRGLTVFYMQTSLFSYWAIVRKRLRDHAHLLVMFSLCGKLRKWEELMDSLWRENSALYIRLLVENRDVAQRRTQLQNRIQRLQEASQVLNSITMEL